MSTLGEKPDGVNGGSGGIKSTRKTGEGEKAPVRQGEKAPVRQKKKAPSYYKTSALSSVVSGDVLESLLYSKGQDEWCSPTRLCGLLLLLSWICKQGGKVFALSGEAAEQYISSLKRRKTKRTIQEPLGVLCAVGIIQVVAKAVCCHVRVSTKYELAPEYVGKVRQFDVPLPRKLHSKLTQADSRREQRLNKKDRFREPLLADLARLELAPEARPVIARLYARGSGGSGLQGIVGAIDTKRHSVRVDVRGTVHTSISSLPRELKGFVTLDGKPAISCDVSHMHHNFLPRLLADRIAFKHREHPTGDLQHLEAERVRLVERLSSSDYYRSWCKDETDDAERKQKKGLINALLNMPNSKCTANGFYQWMRRTFPLTFGIVEDIKRDDQRNLSKQLQRFTSNAINGALRELQTEGIAAIPQTDAILCQAHHEARVRRAIGEWVFRESTGVRCKVNGVPFA